MLRALYNQHQFGELYNTFIGVSRGAYSALIGCERVTWLKYLALIGWIVLVCDRSVPEWCCWSVCLLTESLGVKVVNKWCMY